MRRLLAVSTSVFLLAALFSIPTGTVLAASKTVTGTVTAVSADSLTLKAKEGEMKLVVDAKTTVVGRGMGTKSKEMKEEKKPTQIVDFVKTGDEVSVTYDEATKHVTQVRVTKPAPTK